MRKENVNALLISINAHYSDCQKISDPVKRNKAIMETCCGCWWLSENREPDYVFASEDSRIVGVYRIKKKIVEKNKTLNDIHSFLDCVDENSGYPNNSDTVAIRKKDFSLALAIAETAEKLNKSRKDVIFLICLLTFKKVLNVS